MLHDLGFTRKYRNAKNPSFDSYHNLIKSYRLNLPPSPPPSQVGFGSTHLEATNAMKDESCRTNNDDALDAVLENAFRLIRT